MAYTLAVQVAVFILLAVCGIEKAVGN
ncbi:putative lipoprotein, partial [Yersinia pestis PY-15]